MDPCEDRVAYSTAYAVVVAATSAAGAAGVAAAAACDDDVPAVAAAARRKHAPDDTGAVVEDTGVNGSAGIDHSRNVDHDASDGDHPTLIRLLLLDRLRLYTKRTYWYHCRLCPIWKSVF